MAYKAKVSFSGLKINMMAGEIREIPDLALAADLLKAGYVEEIKPKRKRGGKDAD